MMGVVGATTTKGAIMIEQTTYSTRDDAIQRQIIEPINAGAANAVEYDIEAIATLVLGDEDQGYASKVGVEEFWTIVADHALLGGPMRLNRIYAPSVAILDSQGGRWVTDEPISLGTVATAVEHCAIALAEGWTPNERDGWTLEHVTDSHDMTVEEFCVAVAGSGYDDVAAAVRTAARHFTIV